MEAARRVIALRQNAMLGKGSPIAKLRDKLGYRFAYPDLYAALEAIEAAGKLQG